MKKIYLDFETRSACDLKKAGAYKYSTDPTTQPTCMAFRVCGGRGPVLLLRFTEINTIWCRLPGTFAYTWEKFIGGGYLFVAHNAFFDRCIYDNVLAKRYGWPAIPPQQWRCTAAKVSACGLPRSLEYAARTLNLSFQKDKIGAIAMMKSCRPTKAFNDWGKRGGADPAPPMFIGPKEDPQLFETLYRYCKKDILTMEALDNALPNLTTDEQQIWFLNQRLNFGGVRVDVPTVTKIVGIIEKEKALRLMELDHTTMGLVTQAGSRNEIMEFLALEGIEMPDIRARTVSDLLQNGKLTPEGRKVLELRKALSKSSTKKYQSFLNRASEDHHIRDILLYHGAHTGRDSGTGVQIQNLPKCLINQTKENPYAAIQNIIDLDTEMLHLLYGEHLDILFSSVLRNIVMASKGCELFVADFSKIEVCVLWWLAGNEAGLKILMAGKDPYKYQAAANTGKTYDEIENDGKDRQLAKGQILGCGFGMGPPKFQESSLAMYGLKLTLEQSKDAVDKYRRTNFMVPKLWKSLEASAILAVETPRKEFRAGKCAFVAEHDFLWVRLPSGRKLAYYQPEILWREMSYGPCKALQFQSLAPNKKDLVPSFIWGGMWAENITQAVARDIMMQSMVRLEKAGFRPLMAVHDEAICEALKGTKKLHDFIQIMCELPKWADAKLPIGANGFVGERYRK